MGKSVIKSEKFKSTIRDDLQTSITTSTNRDYLNLIVKSAARMEIPLFDIEEVTVKLNQALKRKRPKGEVDVEVIVTDHATGEAQKLTWGWKLLTNLYFRDSKFTRLKKVRKKPI